MSRAPLSALQAFVVAARVGTAPGNFPPALVYRLRRRMSEAPLIAASAPSFCDLA